jgi:hypothetical protein
MSAAREGHEAFLAGIGYTPGRKAFFYFHKNYDVSTTYSILMQIAL